VPLRLACLGVRNVFARLGLLPMSDRDKDVGILVLRHQVMVLERQLGEARPRFHPGDRAFLAALVRQLPRDVLRRLRLLVRPDTVLRWHGDLLARHHAARCDPSVRADRGPCARFVPWCCAWRGRIPAEATAARTASCLCSHQGGL
jgi:putative transposase